MRLIKYYGIILVISSFLSNTLFSFIIISGKLYQMCMFIFIILNMIILLKHNEEIVYKEICVSILIVLTLLSKNIINVYFVLSSIFILLVVCFKKSLYIKILSISIILFIMLFFFPIMFVFLLNFNGAYDGNKNRSHIYDDMRVVCGNTEAYASSLGAMDRFHYYMGNYYEIVKIDDIINIVLSFSHEVNQDEYENFIKSDKCKLVSDD